MKRPTYFKSCNVDNLLLLLFFLLQGFSFISASTATSDASGNLRRYCPFLTAVEEEGLTSCALLLMMAVNRISQINLSMMQTRSVLKLLTSLKKAMSSGELVTIIYKELASSTANLAATLSARRDFAASLGGGKFEVDPRFLLFEFCHNLLLRPPQVKLVKKLLIEIQSGKSVCHQMIMGAGKTTVVGPLLAMLLASSTCLMTEVVPNALLDFSTGVLRERFSTVVRKPVFTFTFERYNKITPELLFKLRTARYLRAVVVSTPSAVKSFMLKFLELCHILDGQKNLLNEIQEKKPKKKFSLYGLLGFVPQTGAMPQLTLQQRVEIKGQTDLAVNIFDLFRNGVEIMDEVDLILHPLKSELNWPLGAKEPLDFTRSRAGNGLRWNLPAHLFDAILSCSGMPILADMADSKEACQILDDLAAVVTQGLVSLSLLSTPHLALVSKNFYDDHMKPVLARWLVLWIRAHKLPNLQDAEISEYLMRGQHSSKPLLDKIHRSMADEHVKMLNLGNEWLDTFLPFTLQKINRVHFGLLQPRDVELLENDGVKIPSTRKLMAVPFVGKDVPSRASEFAHPDILIGLTILAFR